MPFALCEFLLCVLRHALYEFNFRFSQVGILNRLILPDLNRRSRRQNLPIMEYRDAVCQGEDHVHIMLDDDHGFAPVSYTHLTLPTICSV